MIHLQLMILAQLNPKVTKGTLSEVLEKKILNDFMFKTLSSL